jgi:hypothetical protein
MLHPLMFFAGAGKPHGCWRGAAAAEVIPELGRNARRGEGAANLEEAEWEERRRVIEAQNEEARREKKRRKMAAEVEQRAQVQPRPLPAPRSFPATGQGPGTDGFGRVPCFLRTPPSPTPRFDYEKVLKNEH